MKMWKYLWTQQSLHRENSKRYFAKYNKKKRTYEALTKLTEETREELAYLESAKHALSMAESEADLKELRKELIAAGEIKTVVKSLKEERRNKRQGETKAKPLHYVTEDGYDLYVGKNNLQNDTRPLLWQMDMICGSMPSRFQVPMLLLNVMEKKSSQITYMRRQAGSCGILFL